MSKIVETSPEPVAAAAPAERREFDLLRAERRRFFQLPPEMTAALGFDGRLAESNDAWESVLGYGPPARRELRLADLLHPEDAAAALASLDRLRSAPGKVLCWEARLRAADGTYHALRWSASRLAGESGFALSLDDVTHARSAEDALRDSIALFKAAIESSADGLLIVDRDGRILRYNSRFVEMWRLPEAVLATREDAREIAFVREQLCDPDGFAAGIADLYARPEAESFDVLRLKDGRVFERFSRPMLRSGRPVGRVWSFRDASQRVASEAQVRQMNAELERRVAERTAQLEAANNELEAFCYSVSHDLRAPLRKMDGFSSLLVERCAGRLDAEAERIIKIIRSNSERMGQLIDDLLAFSRLGRKELARDDVDMTALARWVLDDLRRLDIGRSVAITLRPLARARGDAALLRQVFANLISNAMKFTRRKKDPALEIGSRDSEDGRETVYYFKDNGAGFDMKYAAKLFGVFSRLHTTQEFEGTGIGLALTQRIIKRHGGRAWAEGMVDEGATFYFSLPKA